MIGLHNLPWKGSWWRHQHPPDSAPSVDVLAALRRIRNLTEPPYPAFVAQRMEIIRMEVDALAEALIEQSGQAGEG